MRTHPRRTFVNCLTALVYITTSQCLIDKVGWLVQGSTPELTVSEKRSARSVHRPPRQRCSRRIVARVRSEETHPLYSSMLLSRTSFCRYPIRLGDAGSQHRRQWRGVVGPVDRRGYPACRAMIQTADGGSGEGETGMDEPTVSVTNDESPRTSYDEERDYRTRSKHNDNTCVPLMSFRGSSISIIRTSC